MPALNDQLKDQENENLFNSRGSSPYRKKEEDLKRKIKKARVGESDKRNGELPDRKKQKVLKETKSIDGRREGPSEATKEEKEKIRIKDEGRRDEKRKEKAKDFSRSREDSRVKEGKEQEKSREMIRPKEDKEKEKLRDESRVPEEKEREKQREESRVREEKERERLKEERSREEKERDRLRRENEEEERLRIEKEKQRETKFQEKEKLRLEKENKTRREKDNERNDEKVVNEGKRRDRMKQERKEGREKVKSGSTLSVKSKELSGSLSDLPQRPKSESKDRATSNLKSFRKVFYSITLLECACFLSFSLRGFCF